MKKNQFKKNYALTIIAVLVFTTTQAQIKNAEGPPRPGYICRCTVAGYWSAGSYACLLRCVSACRPKLIKIGTAESTPVTNIYPYSLSQANLPVVLLVKPEKLQRESQLVWGSMNFLNTGISENNFMVVAGNGSEPIKLYTVN